MRMLFRLTLSLFAATLTAGCDDLIKAAIKNSDEAAKAAAHSSDEAAQASAKAGDDAVTKAEAEAGAAKEESGILEEARDMAIETGVGEVANVGEDKKEKR